ncbi:Syntaxin-71 [Vitis vinifera]|uniref:Syntaxin-71 n=1 Tax=Vitis vinifera TaxID=29760 RepID=A0A438JM36_VITVI|nr:Syntaxin-71 [Vitis vinifera]
MSVIDLIERVDAICRRYEKYDLDNHNEALGSQYDVVEAGIEASLQKLEAATTEEDRAFDVAMKADVQQTKAYLLEEVSELQKLTLERVNVLSKEEFVAQNDLISMLKERIEAISDGIARGAKQTGGWATSASHEGIKIGSTSDKRFGSNYCQQTEESIRFRQGNEMQKMKQASFPTGKRQKRFPFLHKLRGKSHFKWPFELC